ELAGVRVGEVCVRGCGWRLARGLRRLCRGIPLVRRAEPGETPGGSRLRSLSRADRADPELGGCACGSPRTGLARRLETRDVNQSQVNGTGIHGDGSRRTAVPRGTPTHPSHRTEAAGPPAPPPRTPTPRPPPA